MNDELNFDDVTPIALPVRIGGRIYELREATAEAARQWANAKARGLKFQDGEMSGVDGVADCEILLLSLCLFEITGENSFKTVHPDTIRGWKNSMVSKMYKRLLEISELDDESEEALQKQLKEIHRKLDRLKKEPAKNVPEPSTDTSG